MVTSGTGGLYRPNIPVAIVLRIDGDAAIAVPLANPAKVETVIVQHIFQPSLVRKVEEQRNEAVANPSPATEKPRSEEHTSELQSLMRNSYAVFCLKKKIKTIDKTTYHTYNRILTFTTH